nr:hypothetical protein [Lachnospiraceae bacterium]
MKKRQKMQLLMVMGLLALLIIIIAVILILVLSRKKLETLTLTPTFQETELDVNSDYMFVVSASPEDIKLKDLEFFVDDTTAVFSSASEDNTQVALHTGAEGTVNVYVKQGDIASNYMTFAVVDQTAKAEAEAREQEEAAAAAAAAELEQQQLEAEEEAVAKEYVKTTTDVRV